MVKSVLTADRKRVCLEVILPEEAGHRGVPMDGLDSTADEGTCYVDLSSAGSTLKQHTRQASAPEPERWSQIARTIESEVIPRLMLSQRRPDDALPASVEASRFDTTTPETLANLTLGQHDDEALAFVHALLADGLPLESIFLDLLAPAARILGKRWEEDTLSFAEVTIALTKLQRLMRRLAAVSRPTGAAVDRGAVLLTAVPGEQHLFGVLMLEEFFRRDGWRVDVLPGATRETNPRRIGYREPHRGRPVRQRRRPARRAERPHRRHPEAQGGSVAAHHGGRPLL